MRKPDEHHRALILAANEIVHDLEEREYENAHPEIFERERTRWKRITAASITAIDRERTWLDIGSGTGFVGMQLAEHVREGDRFICADISAAMLEVARKNLEAAMPQGAVQCVKLENEELPLPDASVDVLTMNSVLHHIPDVSLFLGEVERVLAPGGTLIIGHEPNARYAQSSRLRMQEKVLRVLHPKRIILWLWHGKKKQPIATHDPFLDAVNVKLTERHLIEAPLSRSVLATLVDAHSPTAGGIHREVGFDPATLLKTYAPAIEPLHRETYNHLGKLSGKHMLYAPYERFLHLLLPERGATFFLSGQKRSA